MSGGSITQQMIRLEMVDSFYKSNDYAINTFFTDGEFDCLKNAIEGITWDTSSKNEHLGDIERVVWTDKDRVCVIRGGPPFPSCHTK